MGNDYISVSRTSVGWLKKNYPVLCEKAGLTEVMQENAENKMREILFAIDAALKMGIPAAEVLDENSTIRDEIRDVLTPNVKVRGWPPRTAANVRKVAGSVRNFVCKAV